MHILKSLILIFFAAPLMVSAQKFHYTIKGKINVPGKTGTMVLSYLDNGVKTTDSVLLTKGNFSFDGDVHNPAKATLKLSDGSYKANVSRMVNRLEFYIENTPVFIESDDTLANATIHAGPLNEAYQKLQVSLNIVDKKRATTMKEYNAFLARVNKSNSAEEGRIYSQFLGDNPNSIVSIDVLRQYAGSPKYFPNFEPQFNLLSGPVKNSAAGLQFKAQLDKEKEAAKNLGVGKMAPVFVQNDTQGKPVSLADFKGKYVLLDFWASWCGPCRAENPNVVKAFETFKDRNFTVLGVSLDKETARGDWLNAIHKDHLIWTQVSDLKYWDNEAAKMYNVHGIPANFLIGPDGKILATNLRGAALQLKLAELIK